jgi:type I restriction enzyme S subunit
MSIWRESKALPRPVLKTVGELVTELRYGTAQKCQAENTGIAVLRIPNVSSGSIDMSDLKYANLDESEHNKLKLIEGDILVIRSNGSPGLVGRAAMVSGEAVGMAYAGYLIRLRPKQALILPKFLSLMLEAPQLRKVIEVGARSTSGVHNINSNELAALVMPLPSLLEQDETVRRIEAAFRFIGRLAAETTSVRRLIDHLDQAVLSKAFRGELVPQDPDDEPASVLLERIKGEKCGTTQSRRGRGRPKVVTG